MGESTLIPKTLRKQRETIEFLNLIERRDEIKYKYVYEKIAKQASIC